MATSSSMNKNYDLGNKNISDYVFEMDDSTVDSNKTNPLGGSSIHDRGEIPDFHRRIADDYMILKKIYGNPVVASRLTQEESDFLNKYNFSTLESSTAKQMEEELFLLKKWKLEGAKIVQDISDRIIYIRNKELRSIMARSYRNNLNNECTGYKVFENYLESISKYYNER